jgi:hypothetical protein
MHLKMLIGKRAFSFFLVEKVPLPAIFRPVAHRKLGSVGPFRPENLPAPFSGGVSTQKTIFSPLC